MIFLPNLQGIMEPSRSSSGLYGIFTYIYLIQWYIYLIQNGSFPICKGWTKKTCVSVKKLYHFLKMLAFHSPTSRECRNFPFWNASQASYAMMTPFERATKKASDQQAEARFDHA